MDSFRVFSFYLWFWIVHTAIQEDVVKRRPNRKCGTVTIKGPSVSGSDIKVEFLPTPIESGFSASISCQKPQPKWISMTTNGTIYTYTLKGSSYVNIQDCLIRYSVQNDYCDTPYFEEPILLRSPNFFEPPSGTFLDCSDCFYGYIGERVTFTCGTNTQSQPLHAVISIGATRHNATKTKMGEFAINIQLQEGNHLQNVTCTVTISTHYQMIQSKRLIVINQPTPILDSLSKLIQYENENISCRSVNNRPPPKITFMINDDEFDDVQQNNIEVTGQGLYNITGILNSRKRRHWNNSTMKCCARYLNRSKCSSPQIIRYTFGPEKVSLRVDSRDASSTFQTYNMVCSVYNFSDKCDVNINGVLPLNVSNKREESGHSWTIHHRFSISIESEGQGLTVDCVVTCQSLNQTYTESYQLSEAFTSTVDSSGHVALIGAVVATFAVVLILIVIACVCWKRKKQRHEQNAVNVHQNDNAPTLPAQNVGCPRDAGIIDSCLTASPENEYASVIPKSQRPQRKQEETVPLAAENDCEYAVVNKENKVGTISRALPTVSEHELNYAELNIQTHPDVHQSQHAAVSSATDATEYTIIDFSRKYNNA